jgi:hypothetical protein
LFCRSTHFVEQQPATDHVMVVVVAIEAAHEKTQMTPTQLSVTVGDTHRN